MTKHIGNRVGYAVSFYSAGGVFNLFSQNYFATLSTLTATGGTLLTPGNGQAYHVFTSPGTFDVISGSTGADYLVVGGGGAGGIFPSGNSSGGGGSGGFRTGSISIVPGPYSVTIGAGGLSNSASGNTSTFHTITSAGGGGGSPTYTSAGNPGGSGGGGGGAGIMLEEQETLHR